MSQRPVQRRRSSRPHTQKGSGLQFLLMMGLVGAVASGPITSAASWGAEHPWVFTLPVAATAGVGVVAVYLQKREARRNAIQAQGLRYLEGALGWPPLHPVRIRRPRLAVPRRLPGCAASRPGQRPGSRRKGHRPPQGRRWVIQCKHRKDGVRGSAVGVPDLYVLNGTGR